MHSSDEKLAEVGGKSKYKYYEASQFFKEYMLKALANDGSNAQEVMRALFAWYNSIVFSHLHERTEEEQAEYNRENEMAAMLKGLEDVSFGPDSDADESNAEDDRLWVNVDTPPQTSSNASRQPTPSHNGSNENVDTSNI